VEQVAIMANCDAVARSEQQEAGNILIPRKSYHLQSTQLVIGT